MWHSVVEYVWARRNTHLFYISNLVAKAPGLNLSKKLTNLLSNQEASN